VDSSKIDLREIGLDGMDLIWLRIGTSGEGSCEDGNEPLGSIKCWEVLEWLNNWQLLKITTSVFKLRALSVAWHLAGY
jgi:hypothetical protein